MDKNYIEVSSNYYNAGGGCYVLIQEVYRKDENRTLYVLANGESISVTTADILTREVDVDDAMLEKMQLVAIDVEDFKADTRYYDMMRDCHNEYIKAAYSVHNHTSQCYYDELSDKLQQQITAGYKLWVDDCSELYKTDGNKIIYHKEYAADRIKYERLAVAPDDEYLHNLYRLLEHITDCYNATDTDDEKILDEFYSKPVSITYGERTLHIGNGAAQHNGLIEFLEFLISEV